MTEGFKNSAYTPKSFDSIGGTTPEKPDAPPVLEKVIDAPNEAPKIETYANGNPVAREMHPNNELFGEKATRMIGETGTKISEFGTRTGEFVGSMAQKGGEVFSSIASKWNLASQIANERKLNKLDLNTAPATTGQEVMAEKEDAAKAEDESKIAVAQADKTVSNLSHNFSLESVSEGRTAIKNAAEKSVEAGAKKLSFSERLVATFRKLFGKKARMEKFNAVKKKAASSESQIAVPAQNLAVLTEQRLGAVASLNEAETDSAPEEPVAEAPSAPVAAEIPTQTAEVIPPVAPTEAAPAMPVLEDIGIENAFRAGAGKAPIIQDEGIQDAFANAEVKKIAAEVAWPPPASEAEAPPAANVNPPLPEDLKKAA